MMIKSEDLSLIKAGKKTRMTKIGINGHRVKVKQDYPLVRKLGEEPEARIYVTRLEMQYLWKITPDDLAAEGFTGEPWEFIKDLFHKAWKFIVSPFGGEENRFRECNDTLFQNIHRNFSERHGEIFLKDKKGDHYPWTGMVHVMHFIKIPDKILEKEEWLEEWLFRRRFPGQKRLEEFLPQEVRELVETGLEGWPGS